MDTQQEYSTWTEDPTPQNLNRVVESLSPTISTEIHNYKGPKNLLRSKAKILATDAVRSYSPEHGASLRTWVVSQMRPLHRYGHRLKPISIPEKAVRKAAEIHSQAERLLQKLGRTPTDEEVSDRVGISVRRLNQIRQQARPIMLEGAMALAETDEDTVYDPPATTINPMEFAQEVVYSGLSPRYRTVFEYKTGYKGKPVLSNEAIAKRLGISPPAVSQMSAAITRRLMEASQNVI